MRTTPPNTRATRALIIFAAAAAAAHAGVDPARDGLLPCGYSTHLASVFSIELVSRVTPPGITFGRDGRALALGDVDADGVDDIVMGFAECAFGDCALQSGATRAGAVRVVSGATGDTILEIAGQPWTTPAQIDGFGWSVALADLTGDGRMDLLVGAPLANNARGRVDAFSSDGQHLYSIDGPDGAQRFGELILTLGDATGDGRDECLVLDSQALGRMPTLWALRAEDGSVMHSRVVLSHRVTPMGDRDNDGIPEYACGAPELSIPEERARAFRATTGTIAYQLLAAEGYLAWLGDIDNDGFGEFIQFNSLYEWRAPSQYVLEGPFGLPNFPLPRRTLGAADLAGDGALDVLTLLGPVIDIPDPDRDALALTSARERANHGLFLPRHRALVGGEWLAHNLQRISAGRVHQRDDAADLAIELVAHEHPDDRFLVALYAGPWLPGDVNHDGAVDFHDLNTVLTRFGQSANKDARGDADCSGTVDHEDLRLVVRFFGARLTPLTHHSGSSHPALR